jgi:hypothetical protein
MALAWRAAVVVALLVVAAWVPATNAEAQVVTGAIRVVNEAGNPVAEATVGISFQGTESRTRTTKPPATVRSRSRLARRSSDRSSSCRQSSSPRSGRW